MILQRIKDFKKACIAKVENKEAVFGVHELSEG